MSKIKTMLFDLDGTLIDTVGIILDTFRDAFNLYLPEVTISDQEMTTFLGQTLFQTFGYYTDDEKVTEIVKFYRKRSEEKIKEGLKAYPYAEETLKYLKQKKIQVGIVTSKMREIATSHLKITKLYDYIDGMIGYEDVKEHKPYPEPIEKALVLFNAKKSSTIYVGDHENDMIAAKKAGVMTCAVTYSRRIKEMLQTQPDFVVDDLSQLKDLI